MVFGQIYLDRTSYGTVLTVYHSQRAKLFSVVTNLCKTTIVKSYPICTVKLIIRPNLIALFNNMRTLKFKVKLTITFYAAVSHYRNGYPRAETSKMDRKSPIMNQERDQLTSLK